MNKELAEASQPNVSEKTSGQAKPSAEEMINSLTSLMMLGQILERNLSPDSTNTNGGKRKP